MVHKDIGEEPPNLNLKIPVSSADTASSGQTAVGRPCVVYVRLFQKLELDLPCNTSVQ